METVEQLVSFHHIQVQLQGGAPWGFTLKGGLEHGEPLIITKIEEDGKAAQCKKLRVGDELVNINGSALYGSRQEALILIKSSYRILRMVVRRRSVPVIRPHSWHLAKLSDPPGADSPPVMQLHPGGFSVPWQTGGESSDLSTQWNQLSRYCNADHSSSIGSMESLEPVCQGYYDSQLSPVDPVIFSNKRDSAYSSFSASSNTSDYTVSLRQEDASSMDNLFHSLGSCRYADGRCQDPDSDPGLFHEEAIRKTQSSSGRLETRARPSSYGCEEERGPLGTIRGPPQPPVRRDSFRATQGRPRAVDQRCVSAPVDISGTSSCWAEEPIKIQTRPSGPCELADDTPCQDQYYTFSSQLETCSCSQQGVSCKENVPTSRPPHGFSHSHCPGESPSAGVGGGEELPCSLSEAPKKKHGVGIHRHSAPEKLLSGQLHTLSLSSCRAPQGDLHPLGPWSSLHSEENPEIDSSKNTISQEKWAGSRCSTPGSAGALEPEVPHPNAEVPQAVSGLLPLHQTRCSPLTEPAEETAERPHPVEPRTLEDNCGGPYGVGSRNTLEQEKQEGEEKSQSLAHVAMMDSSRHRRLSKSRRRSERFATNLRNEIQRKKSQLLKCADSGNHLHGAETLEEEEWGEQHGLTSSLDTSARPVKVSSSPASLLDPFDRSASSTRGFGSLQDSVWGCQHTDRTRPSHIRVVEEPAPAGKPRRWRWTREPEPCQNVGARATEENIARKPHTRAKFENGDIPPFADRRRFFEETSRSMSVSNLPGLSGYRQRPEIQWRKLERAKVEIPGRKTEANQRRYSYQGDVDDDVKYYHPQETGRKGFFGSYSGDHEITRTSKQNDCGGSRPSNPEVGEVKVRGTCVLLPSSCFGNQIISQEKSGQKQRCRTPEVHPVKMMEKTKLSRNLSLTERDLMHCRSGLQPTEGTATPHCQYNDPGAAAQYEQRGRALSESSIHVETQHRAVPIHISVADEPAESGVAPQKKGAPPPRPPPPNWEKFYRRRASHHNLFSRPLSPARETPCPSNPAEPSRCLDVTQQSSHSLPLSDNESGAPGPVPSNPAVLQRTLGPGAPVIEALPQTVSYTWLSSSEGAPNREPDMAPNREPDMAPNREPDMAPNREPDRAPNREPDMAPNREPDRSRFSNPIHPSSQGVTEWKNTRVRSLEARAVEEDPARVEFSQEFPLPVSNDTPSRNLEPRSSLIHLEDGTLETDIDTFQESEAMGVLAEEQPQGSARPGAVLETDIDMVQEACLPSTDVLTPCSNPVVEALFGDARGTSQGQLMEELLPWSRVGDVAREIWRGGQSGLELSVDTLVRRARQASPHPQGLDAWCSSYYNTSAAKAQLLNKMKEQTELSEDEEDHELFYKKQLMESLQKKLSVLREAQRGLQVDIQANCQLGEEVEALVLAVCKPGEVDKYRMFIGDLDKVVSLLLSLSSRLLRVESALDSLSPDCGHQERLPLLEKKKQLLAQLGEAQELKEHVERREEAVCRALGRSLGPEQLQDYSHFVKMKAALLVEQRQLEDKIRLGEEQLCGLRESLALGVTVPMDQASGRY